MKQTLNFMFIIFSIHFCLSHSLAKKFSSSSYNDGSNILSESKDELFSKAIEASGLEEEQINLIHENSAGTLIFSDFLKNHPEPLDTPAIVLGMSNHSQKIYFTLYHAILLVKKQIPHWHSVYDWLDLHPTKATSSQFMEDLLKKDRPIYFIVPDQILIDSKFTTSYTRQEMQWLLNNPQLLKRVYFVFGATQIKTDSEWKSWFEMYPLISRDESDWAVVRLAWSWYEDRLVRAGNLHPGLSSDGLKHTTRYFRDGIIQYTPPSSW